jgi:hypothetical protein
VWSALTGKCTLTRISHANPELSTQAFQASGRLAQELEQGVPSPCLTQGKARRCLIEPSAFALKKNSMMKRVAPTMGGNGVAGWQ